MFALVKADQVIKEFRGGTPYVDEAGTQYPANIFSIWSVDELKTLGIYHVVEENVIIDPKVEISITPHTYTINENNVTRSGGKKDKDIDIVKEYELRDIKQTQRSILNGTDWYYIRKEDKGTAIPTDIQNYRDAIRTAGDKMITDVTAVTDKAGFQALYPVWDLDNNNTGGTLNVWPDPKDYNL